MISILETLLQMVGAYLTNSFSDYRDTFRETDTFPQKLLRNLSWLNLLHTIYSNLKARINMIYIKHAHKITAKFKVDKWKNGQMVVLKMVSCRRAFLSVRLKLRNKIA